MGNPVFLFRGVAKRVSRAYRFPVAAKSVAGCGSPSSNRRSSAQQLIAGAFFVPAMPCYGGCARETFGSTGFLLPRSSTLAHSRRPNSRGSERQRLQTSSRSNAHDSFTRPQSVYPPILQRPGPFRRSRDCQPSDRHPHQPHSSAGSGRYGLRCISSIGYRAPSPDRGREMNKSRTRNATSPVAQPVWLTAPQLCAKYEVSRTTWWRWSKNPEFPVAASKGRIVRWDAVEVDSFLVGGLTSGQLCIRYQISRSTWSRWSRSPGFPEPTGIGRMTRWNPNAVDAFLSRADNQKPS